jgi:ABC-type transport system involved in cytochrome c biogenesis ATPase subunit
VSDLMDVLHAFRAQGGIVVLSTHGAFELPNARLLALENFAAERAA